MNRPVCIQGNNNFGWLKMGVGSIIKLRFVYQVFKKLGITMRWGRARRGDCKTPKIKILNDIIKERECPWCNLEIVGAVMLRLASTVIKLLGNILAIYIGCKAIILVVFSGDVYSLVGMMMRKKSGCIQEYRLQVVLCVGALVATRVERLCDVRADSSAYMGNDSIIQYVGGENMRRDVYASPWLKMNSDSGRQFKVEIRRRDSR